MERKVITEDKLKIKYIKQAILSLKKDEEGFVDCMNIGKKLHLKGIQIEGKIGAIVQKNNDIFESKTVDKGAGTIRVVRIKKRIPSIKETFVNTPHIQLTTGQEECRKLWGRTLVGMFNSYFSEERYEFKDIHRENFTNINYPDNSIKEDVIISFKDNRNGLIKGKYYTFEWEFTNTDGDNPYLIRPKWQTVKQLNPKDFINIIYRAYNRPWDRAVGSLSGVMDTVKKQLTASSDGTFIYELLQNANDNPQIENNIEVPVNVEFIISDNYLIYRHTGEPFSAANISAICDINAKNKTKNRNAIGYKGIGFKTVFVSNNYVLLNTGDFQFRFDSSHFKSVKDIPYEITPIWTEDKEIDKEVLELFSNSGYNVQVALRPIEHSTIREIEKSYVYLFKDMFKDKRAILFIPNINSVTLNIDGETTICQKESDEWAITPTPYIYKLSDEEKEQINKEIDEPQSRVPDKYKNLEDIYISFACPVEGNKIKPIVDQTGYVYCYLPTTASFGFPFLMNTDMIPTGPRDDIEKMCRFNLKQANVAGQKFVEWLRDLVLSGKYEYSSIFDLIPDFDKCRETHEKYKDFINLFEAGFIEAIKKVPISPVRIDDKISVRLISEVLYDETKITYHNVFTDNEFLDFNGKGSYLVIKELRYSDDLTRYNTFNHLHEKYVDQSKIFTKANLISFCEKENFKVWIADKTNNIVFLTFLRNRKYVGDFKDKQIFLSEDNGSTLYLASKLYFGIFNVRNVFSEYKEKLNCLSYESTRILNSSTGLIVEEKCSTYFKSFSLKSFLDNIFFEKENVETAISQLSDKERSIKFIRLLAVYEIADSSYKFIPFIDVKGNIIANYNRCVYYASKEATEATNNIWLSKELISIISNDYFVENEEFSTSIRTVLSKLGVKQFTSKSFVNDILLSPENLPALSTSTIQDFATNVSFVKFLLDNSDFIENSTLVHFPLFVHDAKGNETTHANDVEEKIFIYSEAYNEHAQKEWIEDNWMYSLNEEYFNLLVDTSPDKDVSVEKKRITSFFQDKFDIKSFGQANFYHNVLTKKISVIYGKMTNEAILLDFYSYLTKNYDILFDGSGNIRGEKTFANMPYINGNDEIVSEIDAQAVKYLYDEELIGFNKEEWLPNNLVITSSSKYTTLGTKVLTKLGFSDYSMTDFFNSVIYGKKSSLTENLKDFKKNVSFHKFMISHRTEIALKDLQEKLPGYPVFILGDNNQTIYSVSSTGHNISSQEILKFVENRILSIKDIDVIDSAYIVSGAIDYWCNILKNSSFDLAHISQWLTKTKFGIVDAFAKDNQKNDHNKNNVILWNTIKEVFSKDDDIKAFNVLPFIASNQDDEKIDCTWLYLNSKPKTYISDAYRSQKGTDAQLKIYDPKEAYLVDDRYLQNDTSAENITNWFNFWKKLGVKHEISEILISSIIPKLSTLDLFDVPSVLLANRDGLKEKGYDIDKFKNLRIKSIEGAFYSISEIRLIKNIVSEPLSSIRLPEQINDSYSSEVKKFILEIAEIANSNNIISSSDDWVSRKIQYVKSKLMANINSEQADLLGKSRAIYEPALNDILLYCSVLYQSKELPIKPYVTSLKELLIKGEDGKYYNGSDLTLGTQYLPKVSKNGVCDFQGNGIKANNIIKYLSKEYLKCDNWNIVRDIFTTYFNVHFKFEEKHIQLLENHQFALYFWNTYISMPGMIDYVSQLISANKITAQTKCVPTAISTEKPCQIYNRKTIGNMVKRIPEIWPTLICDDSIPLSVDGKDNPIDKISGYKEQLSGKHCLLYLENSDPAHYELRRKALDWLLDDNANVNAEDISKYRESSTSFWHNCEKGKMHIKDMCAIDPSDAYIVQHFSTDPHILPESMFPAGKLLDICSLLRIDVLSKQKSFTATPQNYKPETLECKRILNQRCLLLASVIGKEGCETWKEAYNAYKENVEKCSFVNCGSIELTCKVMPTIKNDDAIMFFRDIETDSFYYVEKWQGKVFYEEFVKACSEALEVPSAADMMLVGNILDEDLSAIGLTKLVNRYCSPLLEDKDFYDELLRLFPLLKNKLSIRETVDTTDTSYDVPAQTTISTTTYDNDKKEIESKSDVDDIPDTTLGKEEKTSSTESAETDVEQPKSIAKETQELESGDSQSEGNNEPTNDANIKKQADSSQQQSQESRAESSSSQEKKKNIDDTEKEEPVKRSQELLNRTRKPQRSVLYEEDSISEKYKPKGNNADITDWKKKQQQIELGVADPNSSELEACRSFIDGSKNDNEIIDEQYLSRYRLYNFLTNVEGIELGDEREFINDKSKKTSDIETNKGYIHARSAKGGILFLSKYLWERLNEDGHRLCMYYGNKGSEFKLIDSVSQLIELVGDDNIIVQVKGSEKYSTIQSIFSGSLKENGKAYVLIRIKSNERYNALFVDIYNNNDDNDAGF